MGDTNTQAKLVEACLLAAAKRGSLVVVRALLSHPSCHLLARDEEGNTALHIAASRGHHEVVLELASRYNTLSEDASAGKNNDGQTPLHLACSKGWIKCVDPLAIKFPSEMNVKDSSGNVPLVTASLAGHDNIASLLKLKYKAKLQSEDIKLPINQEENKKEELEEINTDISKLSITTESSCLVAAAKRGSLVVVRALLSHPSCHLLARDEEGNTALHIAASRGHHEVVLELASRYNTLSEDASAGKNNDGQTPLHLACSKGWIKCVDPLAIKFPSELNVKDSSGNVPLVTASLAGHDNIASLLKLKYKAKLQSEDIKLPINQEENKKEELEEINNDISKLSITTESSCLVAAAKRGSLVLVNALLSHPSCDLLARDKEGNTALHIAASRGHHEVVLELASRYSTLSAGKNDKKQVPLHLASFKGWRECIRILVTTFKEDVAIKEEYDNLPLHYAALYGHSNAVDCLCVEFKCDPESKGLHGNNCLHMACRGGHVQLVRSLLVTYRCRRDAVDDSESLATHCAAFYGHLDPLRVLINEFGYSPNAVRATNGHSLCHHACAGKHINTVKYLINECKLDPNTRDQDGCSSIHHACHSRSRTDPFIRVDDFHYSNDIDPTPALVDMLISNRCNPMDRTNNGSTAVHIAAATDTECAIIEHLVLKHNCSVHCVDNNDNTPLHTAASKGHLNVVQVLLSELGADVQARNKQNETALHVAALNGHSNVVTILVEQFTHAKGFNNRTPLHHACGGGHLELVEKLIDDYHCDPMARADEGLTPLHIAALAGKEQLLASWY